MDKIKLHEKDFETIKNILNEMDETKLTMVCASDNRIMMDSEVDTELFITSYIPDVLVIQRVCIKNQRKGTFSKVLKEIKTIAKTHGFKSIIVQSVMTEAMAKFCLKHGFIAQTYHNFGINDFSPLELFCDYKLEVQ